MQLGLTKIGTFKSLWWVAQMPAGDEDTECTAMSCAFPSLY